MGGEISVHSVPGAGSRFAFTIPLLLDRRIGLWAAVLVSWRCVVDQPVLMALWAACLMGLSALAMAPALLGLPVLLPILAHASWHAYQDLVDASAVPQRT